VTPTPDTENETELFRSDRSAFSEPAADGAAPDLPEGWNLVRCDHRGNITRFGAYWRAVRNDGAMTEPTQYPDSAVRQAQQRRE
jgi:hypothetical protein